MPDGPRRRRGALGAVAGVVTFGVVLGAGALGVTALLDGLGGATRAADRCAAVLDGTQWYLAPDQAETAALLATATVRRGMPARAATIAIATGLQESRLRNIDYGDRDSVGIFQQRPSQGWGTVEQIMDPVYSTTAFLDALEKVDGYQDLEITVAAQEVQRSAFPDAYAQHEVRSRAWASALTGHSPATLTCELGPVEGPGDPEGLAARAVRDLGLQAVPAEDGVLVLDPGALPAVGGTPRAGWVAAQWAVAVADAHGVERVEHAGLVWERGSSRWSPAAPAPTGTGAAPADATTAPSDVVRVALAAAG